MTSSKKECQSVGRRGLSRRASADMLYLLLTCFTALLVGMEEGIIAQSVCDRDMCRKKESTRSTA